MTDSTIFTTKFCCNNFLIENQDLFITGPHLLGFMQ